MSGLYADLIPDEIKANVRRHRIIPVVPFVSERVMPIGQSYEAQLARKHLASLSPERLAELDKEFDRG